MWKRTCIPYTYAIMFNSQWDIYVHNEVHERSADNRVHSQSDARVKFRVYSTENKAYTRSPQ